MKLVTLIYDNGIDEAVIEQIDALVRQVEDEHVRGWTRLCDVQGYGGQGYRRGDPVFPGTNNVLWVALPDELVAEVWRRMRALQASFRLAGITILAQPVEVLGPEAPPAEAPEWECRVGAAYCWGCAFRRRGWLMRNLAGATGTLLRPVLRQIVRLSSAARGMPKSAAFVSRPPQEAAAKRAALAELRQAEQAARRGRRLPQAVAACRVGRRRAALRPDGADGTTPPRRSPPPPEW